MNFQRIRDFSTPLFSRLREMYASGRAADDKPNTERAVLKCDITGCGIMPGDDIIITLKHTRAEDSETITVWAAYVGYFDEEDVVGLALWREEFGRQVS